MFRLTLFIIFAYFSFAAHSGVSAISTTLSAEQNNVQTHHELLTTTMVKSQHHSELPLMVMLNNEIEDELIPLLTTLLLLQFVLRFKQSSYQIVKTHHYYSLKAQFCIRAPPLNLV